MLQSQPHLAHLSGVSSCSLGAPLRGSLALAAAPVWILCSHLLVPLFRTSSARSASWQLLFFIPSEDPCITVAAPACGLIYSRSVSYCLWCSSCDSVVSVCVHLPLPLLTWYQSTRCSPILFVTEASTNTWVNLSCLSQACPAGEIINFIFL